MLPEGLLPKAYGKITTARVGANNLRVLPNLDCYWECKHLNTNEVRRKGGPGRQGKITVASIAFLTHLPVPETHCEGCLELLPDLACHYYESVNIYIQMKQATMARTGRGKTAIQSSKHPFLHIFWCWRPAARAVTATLQTRQVWQMSQI